MIILIIQILFTIWLIIQLKNMVKAFITNGKVQTKCPSNCHKWIQLYPDTSYHCTTYSTKLKEDDKNKPLRCAQCMQDFSGVKI